MPFPPYLYLPPAARRSFLQVFEQVYIVSSFICFSVLVMEDVVLNWKVPCGPFAPADFLETLIASFHANLKSLVPTRYV